MKVVIDIECNALKNPTKVWLVICKDIDKGDYHVFRRPSEDSSEALRFLEFAKRVDCWIGHNLLGYDWPVLVDLLGLEVPNIHELCIDTLIISKLVDYPRQGHSVEDYGLEFGLEKGKFSDWAKYSQEMEDYCIRDVDITEKIYKKYEKYINKKERRASIVLEHEFQLICNNLEKNGFAFNTAKAQQLLTKVQTELDSLDKDILSSFPPREVLIREFTPRATKFGTINKSSVPRVLHDRMHEFEIDKTYRHTKEEAFNPSSHKQIIQVLREAGWKPVDKTKTHIETERECNTFKFESGLTEAQAYAKLEILKKVGWKVNEQNISSLPEIEPLELWKRKCQLKISQEDCSGFETITNAIKNINEQKLENITIKIPAFIKTDNLNVFMELILSSLKKCTKDNLDCAKFVEKEKNSWWIIVTPQDVYVDCSASFVTDIWAGLRNTKFLQETISQLKSARFLAKRILLESRRRTLTEWLSLCVPSGPKEDRIHGRFYGIGAWTHRMAHQAPNTANIPNEFDTAGRKKLLGKELRSLWCAPRNRLLVGVDAEGIQLRIFAHYINDPAFTEALVNGKKEDKTDPHNLNQSILGDVCKSRQAAKRYIYALLLGAGQGKLREILECSEEAAVQAYDRLLKRYTGFAYLKEKVIPADAKRGWFLGLDGRAVRIPGESNGTRRHLCMSGYLQNGEAVIMKKATVKWWHSLKDYDAKLVNFVHDEWQVECPNNVDTAISIATIMSNSLKETGEDLNLKCPLAGSFYNDDIKDYTIATNWSKTH